MNYIKSVKKLANDGEQGDNMLILTDKQDNKLFVPKDEDNRHYQDILEWEKIDGNTIAEAD
jgi:murein L,D-transpeptidase YafK